MEGRDVGHVYRRGVSLVAVHPDDRLEEKVSLLHVDLVLTDHRLQQLLVHLGQLGVELGRLGVVLGQQRVVPGGGACFVVFLSQ